MGVLRELRVVEFDQRTQTPSEIHAGDCPLAHGDHPKKCSWCGEWLCGRRRRWCSDECNSAFLENHYWQWARHAALQRDGQMCRTCGRGWGAEPILLWMLSWSARQQPVPARLHEQLRTKWWDWQRADLEVNHRVPILGKHAQAGCWHHLDGLETLCHAHHVVETNRQFGRGPRVDNLPLL